MSAFPGELELAGTHLHCVPGIYKNEKQNKPMSTWPLSSTQFQWLALRPAEKNSMSVFTVGDESGKERSPDFKWQILFQGVGDSRVQSQGRENSPHFHAMMDAISFGTSHTCSFGDHLETISGQTIYTLTQDVGTRWLKQNMRWVVEKSCDTLNFLKGSEKNLKVWRNTKEWARGTDIL